MKKILAAIIIALSLFACKQRSDMKLNDNRIVNTDSTYFDSWNEMTYSEREGKSIYDKYCIHCHGKYGEADGFNSYNLKVKPVNLIDSVYQSETNKETIKQIIINGGKSVNKSSQMPFYKNTLSLTEINAVVEYIKLLPKLNK